MPTAVIEMIADEGSFEEWDKEMEFVNPLDFKGYEEKVAGLKEHTHLNEAVVTGKASINGNPVVLGICDGRFMMASMGHDRRGEDRPSSGAGHRGEASGDYLYLFRRSQDAGGHCFSDADGEDLRGSEAAQ